MQLALPSARPPRQLRLHKQQLSARLIVKSPSLSPSLSLFLPTSFTLAIPQRAFTAPPLACLQTQTAGIHLASQKLLRKRERETGEMGQRGVFMLCSQPAAADHNHPRRCLEQGGGKHVCVSVLVPGASVCRLGLEPGSQLRCSGGSGLRPQLGEGCRAVLLVLPVSCMEIRTVPSASGLTQKHCMC